MKYLIFIINLCFCFYACETPQNPCTKNGFSTSIYIKDLQYKPRKGKLYLYKENSNFEELINVVDSINIFNEKNKILFFQKIILGFLPNIIIV